MSTSRTQFIASADHRPRTIATRYMADEKALDGTLVEQWDRQATLGHPSRQMRNSPEVPLFAAGRVPATLQIRGKCVGVWSENTVEKPGLRRGVQGDARVHDGLLTWVNHLS